MNALKLLFNYKDNGYVCFNDSEIFMRINIKGSVKDLLLFLNGKGFFDAMSRLISRETNMYIDENIFEVNT